MRGALLLAVALTACSSPPSAAQRSLPGEGGETGPVIDSASIPRQPCSYSLAFDGDRYTDSTQCFVDDAGDPWVLGVRIVEQPWSVHLHLGATRHGFAFVPRWSTSAEVVSADLFRRGDYWEVTKLRLETPDGHLVLGDVWATF